MVRQVEQKTFLTGATIEELAESASKLFPAASWVEATAGNSTITFPDPNKSTLEIKTPLPDLPHQEYIVLLDLIPSQRWQNFGASWAEGNTALSVSYENASILWFRRYRVEVVAKNPMAFKILQSTGATAARKENGVVDDRAFVHNLISLERFADDSGIPTYDDNGFKTRQAITMRGALTKKVGAEALHSLGSLVKSFSAYDGEGGRHYLQVTQAFPGNAGSLRYSELFPSDLKSTLQRVDRIFKAVGANLPTEQFRVVATYP